MAIDPQFISLDAARGLRRDRRRGGARARAARAARRGARRRRAIDYAAVRELKRRALRRAFARFRDTRVGGGTRRAAAFRAYMQRAGVVARRLRAVPRAARAPRRAGLDRLAGAAARAASRRRSRPRARELADDILFRQYLQWIAGDQWGTARDAAGDVALFGDLPFMVSGDSADVWARQDEFRLDASVGVPPDAFSETGQDWGLPVYRWDVLARARLRLAAQPRPAQRRPLRRLSRRSPRRLLPHLLPPARRRRAAVHAGRPRRRRRALGERVLAVFREPGAEIIAEDLGIVPDFVRESLARLGVPGYKVFRWEREWNDARAAVPRSGGLSGRVASPPPARTTPSRWSIWWENAPREERQAVLAIPSVRERLDRRRSRTRARRAAACRTPCTRRCSRRSTPPAPTS